MFTCVLSQFTRRALLLTLVFSLLAGLPVALAQDEELLTAEETVAAFYTWYLGYIDYQGEFNNPLVDGAYQQSDFLSADFIAEVEAILEDPNTHHDPILCAQNIPDAFSVAPAPLPEDMLLPEDEARVRVYTSFAGFHALDVDLIAVTDDGQRIGWLIDGITCQVEPGPADIVQSFYTMYLSYFLWDGEGKRPNSLTMGAYRWGDLLTDDLVAALDAYVENIPADGGDPLLCAQDVPTSFSVSAPLQAGDTARVTVFTSFDDHAFEVLLTQVEDQWRISEVLCFPME